MSLKVVFARTRHVYDSYADFWSLVEVCGFKTCFVDQMRLDRPNTVYITTPWNGDTGPAVRAARMVAGAKLASRVIWWHLERPDGASTPLSHQIDEVMAPPLVDDIWVSDSAFAALDPRLRRVNFGSHAGLGVAAADRPIYDVAPYAYLWGRRTNMVESLQRAGLRVAPNAWTAEQRQEVLSSSRIMLSLHQYPQAPRVIAPIRCAVAAAYRLPFVTEELDSAPAPLVAERDYTSVTPDDLVERVIELLRDHDRRAQLSWSLFSRLCIDYPFDQCVYQAAQVWETP